MKLKNIITLSLAVFVLIPTILSVNGADKKKPNVVMIILELL